MTEDAATLARRLARDPEAVCRHYLMNGRRAGRYWLVGDVLNTPGRSLYVRLGGPEAGRGAAGRWTDAATGEHGDLLDLIAANRGLSSLHDVLAEARRFLSLPRPATHARQASAPAGSPEAARRLFAMAQPIAGTPAEDYLRTRRITALRGITSLRFHPHCYYRPDARDLAGTRKAWPALVACVTDLDGRVTGVQRTWLDPSGSGKAPVAAPRRALGDLLGHGVRFGMVAGVVAAGEGIETMLSLRSILPTLPVVAALSANHLAAFLFPVTLRRLYVAEDDDPAGRRAADALLARARADGIGALRLKPRLGDLNEDLTRLGAEALLDGVRGQLAPEDVARFAEGQATRWHAE